jgi:hypothetical protein
MAGDKSPLQGQQITCACCRLYEKHPTDLSREELEKLWREFIAEGKQGGGR